MTVTHAMKPRCHAHNRQGKQCGNLSVPGARVCRMHGGLIPQVQVAAAERLRRLTPSAIDVLEDLLGQSQPAPVRLASANSILDRAGVRASDQAVDGAATTMRVTIAFDHNDNANGLESTTLSLPDAE
jgi:hypothetical protein